MKKTAVILLAAAVLLGVSGAEAVGGSSTDPLISKSYIETTYIPGVLEQTGERVDQMGGDAYGAAAEELSAFVELGLAKAGGEGWADSFREQRFKRGDKIRVDAGSGAVLLAGEAAAVFDGGVVIDVTAGETVPSGGAMEPNHFYLAGEETVCDFTVLSETAVLAPQGYFAVSPSGEVDFNELADALRDLGLFRGSTTAFGSGYELEMPPTRIQGLIMFLRLIGEEEAALAYTGPAPFSDVPDWCKCYVGYAVEKGYAKGYPNGCFGTLEGLTGQQYITFLLRVLGYQDGGEDPDFDYDTVISQAKDLGVITAGEQEALASESFLRSEMVYFSYYALLTGPKDGDDALIAYLVEAGAVDWETAVEVTQGVESLRRP